MHIINMIIRRSYFVIIPLLILSSCKKDLSPSGPEELKTGRRDYEWTVDTMMPTPYNQITRMWACSEDNIWAAASPGDYDKSIWHYDGKKWQFIPNKESAEPFCIYGIDNNNIWVTGPWGSFWKYSNGIWVKTDDITNEDYPKITMVNMWGDAPDNIYASGGSHIQDTTLRAALAHYDGKKWSLINTPKMKGVFYNLGKDVEGSGLLFMSLKDWRSDSVKICTFDGSNINVIYRGRDYIYGDTDVYMLGQKMYIVIGKKLYIYRDNKLVLINDMSNSNFQARIWGRNENDFFYLTNDYSKGHYSGIGHYNGKDFVTVFPNFDPPNNAVVTEKAVLFETFNFDLGRVIFLKGKLK